MYKLKGDGRHPMLHWIGGCSKGGCGCTMCNVKDAAGKVIDWCVKSSKESTIRSIQSYKIGAPMIMHGCDKLTPDHKIVNVDPSITVAGAHPDVVIKGGVYMVEEVGRPSIFILI